MDRRYSFTGQPGSVPEQVKDTDLTHDSPHHTIGNGATQAAAGNHTHFIEEIRGIESLGALGLSDSIPISNTGTGASGTGSTAARGDHAHPAIPGLTLSNSIPAIDGGTGKAGTAITSARGDHQHPAHNASFAENADTVDGKHAADFATDDHKHSGADITSGTVARARMPYRLGRNGPHTVAANQSTSNITIPHGLGATPAACFVSVDGDVGAGSLFVSIEAFNSTNILAQIRNIDNSSESGVYVNWVVFL